MKTKKKQREIKNKRDSEKNERNIIIKTGYYGYSFKKDLEIHTNFFRNRVGLLNCICT